MSIMADHPFPPAALRAAGLVMLGSLVFVGCVQWHKFHSPPAQIDAAAPLRARMLRFVDLNDGMTSYGGHVQVTDIATGKPFAALAENEGFVRAALNALAFERHKAGLAGPLELRLALWPDGSLTLEDPTLSRVVHVSDFGAGNRAAFIRFLTPPMAPPAPRPGNAS